MTGCNGPTRKILHPCLRSGKIISLWQLSPAAASLKKSHYPFFIIACFVCLDYSPGPFTLSRRKFWKSWDCIAVQVQKVQKGAEGAKGGGGDAIRYPLSAYRLLYGCIPERNDRVAGHQASGFCLPGCPTYRSKGKVNRVSLCRRKAVYKTSFPAGQSAALSPVGVVEPPNPPAHIDRSILRTFTSVPL